MSKHRILFSVIFFLLLFLSPINAQMPESYSLSGDKIDREFRAAWIATVANINWPSKPGLSMEEQKNEAVALLDLLKRCNYNAAIFQVRPQADALYESDLEPWSYFLTGEQGVAPSEFYDPLEFWIEEAHKRCIELHAWINPYRAHHANGGEVSEYSIVNQKPELVLKLEEGYWWFDPSLEETQDHLYIVVMDIARRYDVDGIHFDDYFYPYPSYNGDKQFPDSNSWRSYKSGGGKLQRNDWRRENVNKFIERIYTGLKLMKPHVKFGLSPFGIWRPNNPPSIQGFDQYEELFADAKLWLNKGWIDYFSPQLYWTINDIDQSFPVLLSWWKSENIKNRHLWVGSNISRGADEMINQIMITRGMFPENPGNVHWSIAPMVEDSALAISIAEGPYNKQVLVPPVPWLWNKPPVSDPAEIKITKDEIIVKQNIGNIKKNSKWILYTKYGDKWEYRILPAGKTNVKLSRINDNSDSVQTELLEIGTSIVDRYGNESSVNFIKFNNSEELIKN